MPKAIADCNYSIRVKGLRKPGVNHHQDDLIPGVSLYPDGTARIAISGRVSAVKE
jgi:hypothetical protein